MRWYWALMIFAAMVAVPPTLDARIWKTSSGGLEAEFVRLEGDQVLLNENGQPKRIAVASLSRYDQQWIRAKAGMVVGRGSQPVADARTWTDTKGRTIKAQYSRLEGDRVVLWFNNQEVKVPYGTLGPDDLAYIREEEKPPSAEDAPVVTESGVVVSDTDFSKPRQWGTTGPSSVAGILIDASPTRILLSASRQAIVLMRSDLDAESRELADQFEQLRRAKKDWGEGILNDDEPNAQFKPLPALRPWQAMGGRMGFIDRHLGEKILVRKSHSGSPTAIILDQLPPGDKEYVALWSQRYSMNQNFWDRHPQGWPNTTTALGVSPSSQEYHRTVGKQVLLKPGLLAKVYHYDNNFVYYLDPYLKRIPRQVGTFALETHLKGIDRTRQSAAPAHRAKIQAEQQAWDSTQARLQAEANARQRALQAQFEQRQQAEEQRRQAQQARLEEDRRLRAEQQAAINADRANRPNAYIGSPNSNPSISELRDRSAQRERREQIITWILEGICFVFLIGLGILGAIIRFVITSKVRKMLSN